MRNVNGIDAYEKVQSFNDVICAYHTKFAHATVLNTVETCNYLTSQKEEVSLEALCSWLSNMASGDYIRFDIGHFEYSIEKEIKTTSLATIPKGNDSDYFTLYNIVAESLMANTSVEAETVQEPIETDTNTHNNEIERPFNVGSVDIVSQTIALSNIISRLKNKEIKLDTDFQRSQNLWDKQRQSLLIESILVKFPLPAFYFDISDENNWLVIDGLQRLSTIKNFVVDQILRLQGLEFLSEGQFNFNNKYYEDLPRDFQRRIEEAQVTTYQIRKGTPEEVKFNLFKRINTGGLVLSAAEIRHALNQGPIAQLMKDLASTTEFQNATSYSISRSRMEDRDFVVRFLAFYMIPYTNYGKPNYKSDLDGYINLALARLKEQIKSDPNLIDRIRKDFKRAMLTCWQIFGKYSFRKQLSFRPDIRRRPINKALFEVLSSFLASQDEMACSKYIKNKSAIQQAIAEKMSEQYYYDAFTVATGERKKVTERHESTIAIFEQTLTT